MMGEFYVIATPIGNLEDISLRAVETLKKVDLILCEDTRVTKKLLDRYSISKPTMSYHQHSRLSRVEAIIEHLENGKTCGLVTDAGTPGMSDPGNELVAKIIGSFKGKIKIIPIPGPSAVSALVSVAGINMSKFNFRGFAPHKKGRETFFRSLASAAEPVIYFESPHRLIRNLELLEKICEEEGIDKKLIVGRELTKFFEEINRGRASEIIQHYRLNKDRKKGEFVIIAHNC